MSDYAIVNLLELEDTVSERVPGLEGRFGRTQLESRAGSGRVRLGDEVRDVRRGKSSASRRSWCAPSRRGRTGWS